MDSTDYSDLDAFRGWERLMRLVVVPPKYRGRHCSTNEQTVAAQRDFSGGPSSIDRNRLIRSHTPACCQSRKRRQHVIPDPHPSSSGSICQGIPLRRTKTMPVRHARSETRGRPPCGCRGGIGKRGSTRSHNASGSSAAAMPVHATSPTGIKFRRFCYTL
jgi:hypothetical protein